MASPRSSSPRGRRALGEPSSKSVPEVMPEPEVVSDPTRARHVVDYSMKRRAALKSLRCSGLLDEICDADPMLLRTAKHHGEPLDRPCPVCRKQPLTQLTYTFGAEMGVMSGRVRAKAELLSLALEYGSFRVYVVEVCQSCAWNHLVLSYVLGDGVPRVKDAPTQQRRTGIG